MNAACAQLIPVLRRDMDEAWPRIEGSRRLLGNDGRDRTAVSMRGGWAGAVVDEPEPSGA